VTWASPVAIKQQKQLSKQRNDARMVGRYLGIEPLRLFTLVQRSFTVHHKYFWEILQKGRNTDDLNLNKMCH
jgi:hypothetical protein